MRAGFASFASKLISRVIFRVSKAVFQDKMVYFADTVHDPGIDMSKLSRFSIPQLPSEGPNFFPSSVVRSTSTSSSVGGPACPM